jgi:hypothetical protein
LPFEVFISTALQIKSIDEAEALYKKVRFQFLLEFWLVFIAVVVNSIVIPLDFINGYYFSGMILSVIFLLFLCVQFKTKSLPRGYQVFKISKSLVSAMYYRETKSIM